MARAHALGILPAGTLVAAKNTLPLAGLLLCWAADASGNPLGYHDHGGFYLRLGGGAAGLVVTRETDQTAHVGTESSVAYEGAVSRLGGVSVFSELSVGGTPFRGVAIAGTLLWHGLPSAELRLASGSRIDLGNTLVFAVLGPTVDWYPDPERGFHVGAGLFAATTSVGISDPVFSHIGGLGVGTGTSLGWDLWTGDDWSVGGTLRGVVARVGDEQTSADTRARERDVIASASLSLALVYH